MLVKADKIPRVIPVFFHPIRDFKDTQIFHLNLSEIFAHQIILHKLIRSFLVLTFNRKFKLIIKLNQFEYYFLSKSWNI
jgi:hypothetical protein